MSASEGSSAKHSQDDLGAEVDADPANTSPDAVDLTKAADDGAQSARDNSQKRPPNQRPAATASSPLRPPPGKKPAMSIRSQVGQKRNPPKEATLKAWLAKHPWLRVRAGVMACAPCSNAATPRALVTLDPMREPKGHAENAQHKMNAAAAGASVDISDLFAAGSTVVTIKESLAAAERRAEPAAARAKEHLVNAVFAVAKARQPMLAYAGIVLLLKKCGVNTGTAHGSDDAGWEILEAIDAELLNELRERVAAAAWLSIILDSTTDNGKLDQVDIEVRFWDSSTRELCSYFVALVDMDGNTTAAGYKEIVHRVVVEFLDLTVEAFAAKLAGMGADGAATMSGATGGLFALMRADSPFMQSGPCAAHKVALASKVLLLCDTFASLSSMVATLASFCHSNSPKRFARFKSVQEQLEAEGLSRGLVTLACAATRWLSIHAAMERVWDELPAVLYYVNYESGVKSSNSQQAGHLLDELLDLDMLLAFTLFPPLLGALNAVVKVFQEKELFLPDAAACINRTVMQLRSAYEQDSAFSAATFPQLHALLRGVLSAEEITGSSAAGDNDAPDDSAQPAPPPPAAAQVILVCNEEGHILLKMGDAEYQVYTNGLNRFGNPSRARVPVTKEMLLSHLAGVREAVKLACAAVKSDLRERFPVTELMRAWGALQPAFFQKADSLEHAESLVAGAASIIGRHLAVVFDKNALLEQINDYTAFAYDFSVQLKEEEETCAGLLKAVGAAEITLADAKAALEAAATMPPSPEALAHKKRASAAVTDARAALAVAKKKLANHIKIMRTEGGKRSATSALWRAVEQDEYRMAHFLEWHKLAMFMLAVPITSVEPERRFSLLGLVKTDLRTCLSAAHLNACVRVASCQYTVETYDPKPALNRWNSLKKRHV